MSEISMAGLVTTDCRWETESREVCRPRLTMQYVAERLIFDSFWTICALLYLVVRTVGLWRCP